jgi:hypothetical protein
MYIASIVFILHTPVTMVEDGCGCVQRTLGPGTRGPSSSWVYLGPGYLRVWVYPGLGCTAGRCADGALGDTPGEFKGEHMKILVKSSENLIKLL